MGSLADELEKVKVRLPRSKSVSISRALSHPPGERSPNAQKCLPREMVEALRCKDGDGRERFMRNNRDTSVHNLYNPAYGNDIQHQKLPPRLAEN